MNYVGQLYGRLGRKYFPLGVTTEYVDGLLSTIKSRDELISQYRQEMLALQRKVQEQEEKLIRWEART